MKPSSDKYVTDDEGLRGLCERLSKASRLGLDTEFVGEETFIPRLELIQVAFDHEAAVIDVPAVSSLAPLGGVLADPHIDKVFHAGRQDLELLHLHVGILPKPLFDTQVAAAMVGYGTQVGYAQLVQRVLGKSLGKEHTLTNWSKRPLAKEQLAYALADVEHLLPLHAHLVERLKNFRRLDWAQEEFAALASRRGEVLNDPRMRYERIRGWETLKPRARAILRELAAWREVEARRRNLPRGRIVRDEILLALARHPPGDLTALRGMRGLGSSLVERHDETLLHHIQEGLAIPESEHPRAPKAPRPEPETAGRTDLLQAVLKACAQQASIAPTMIATSADLQSLIQAGPRRESLDLPLLKGWRRHVAGELILKVLEGKRAVQVDARTGKVEIVRTRDASQHT